MSNLERKFQKSGLVARMQHQIEILEQVEMRQMLVIACYEAVASGLDPKLLERTNTMLHGQKFATRQEMYQAALSCAKSVQAELEFEYAAMELDARTKAESTQDSAPAPEPAIPPPGPDTLDK